MIVSSGAGFRILLPPGGSCLVFVRLYAVTIPQNVRANRKTRLKRNAGRNVRKLPMMVPLPSSDNSIGTQFVQNQSASPAFLIRHLPADKRKICKALHHRCLRSNATFPPGEGIRTFQLQLFTLTYSLTKGRSWLLHPMRSRSGGIPRRSGKSVAWSCNSH